MKKPIFAAIITLPFVVGTALAQDSAQAEDRAQTAAVAAAPDAQNEEEAEEERPGDRIICRRERATGSLTRVRRICMTRDEWNGVTAKSQQSHADTVRAASGNRCFQC